MGFVFPLEKMATEDRLAAMEQLWEDLCPNPEAITFTILADIESHYF